MARRLNIAPGLTIPLDGLTETFGIFGQKGSGKSSTSAVFVEQGVHAGGRFVAADPTGVWWGLMHDGTGPGLPGIVFGGEHADVPLEPTAGHVVAEFVVTQDEYPVVVLDMKLMRKAERTHFMLDFLETLYHENREALHVVLDEAHQFAPTQAREGGEAIKLLGAVEDVVALGRARGLGITMISQRFATLNANVREQIGTLAVHRLVGSLDRKALKGWIEANGDPAREKEVLELMAKLKTAQALVWSPAFLEFFGVVNVNAPETFDSRATPKVGQRVKKPGKRAAVDLDTLKARMAETIERAKENDPKELKARLRAALADSKKWRDMYDEAIAAREEATREVEVEKLVDVPVLTPAQERALAQVEAAVERTRVQLERQLAPYARIAETIQKAHDELVARTERQAEVIVQAARVVAKPPPHRPVPPDTSALDRRREAALRSDANGGEVKLKAGARRLLEALASRHPAPQTRSQVALLAKLKKTGGTFGNYLSMVKTAGLAVENGDGLTLTEAGIEYVGGVAEPQTPEEIIDMWRGRLKAGARSMLDYLLANQGRAVSRQELGEATNLEPSGGTFGNYLSLLRTAGLIEDVDGGVQLSSSLYA